MSDAHFDEQSQRILTTADRPSESFLEEWCQDFAVNEETALQMMAKMANHLGEGEGDAIGAVIKFRNLLERGFLRARFYATDIRGSATLELIQSALTRLNAGALSAKETELLVKDYLAKIEFESQMAQRLLWLMLDMKALAGAEDYESLVKLLGRKKATTNKCLQYFQSQIPELPLLPGQRDEEAKESMATAQKNIWHKPPAVSSRKS